MAETNKLMPKIKIEIKIKHIVILITRIFVRKMQRTQWIQHWNVCLTTFVYLCTQSFVIMLAVGRCIIISMQAFDRNNML